MPTKTVFVDSDRASIEVRLAYKNSSTTATAPAIAIAHPYGPLGGNIHNNVAIALQKGFVDRGYTAVSFNFRGCGKSTGKTSWTGMSEQKDYQAVVDYLMKRDNTQHDHPTVSYLFVCGYSYGGMIAAGIRENQVPTSYILISYPLRVTWALATTKTSYFKSQVNNLLSPPPSPPTATTATSTEACQNRQSAPAVLLIFGDQDQFTGLAAYQSWVKTITSDTVQNSVIEGVDHFWMDRESQLLDEIFSWLSTLPQSQ
ncbi:unnamed protein product [Absidia cylindrospora]